MEKGGVDSPATFWVKSELKRIVFRTDASNRIGTGHVMRCLTLAEELRNRGACCHFVCREHPGHLGNLISERGFDLALLAVPDHENRANPIDLKRGEYGDWLWVSQERDAQDTLEVVGNKTWDWLVVDHYGLDYRWEGKVRDRIRKIFVIDDLADRPHNCDGLLDQNLFENEHSRYVGLVPSFTKLFLGPKFALLNSLYREMKKENIFVNQPRSNYFVFFGGTDQDNLTGLTVESIQEIDPTQKTIVVIGSNYHYKERLFDLASKSSSVMVHGTVPSLAPFLESAGLAFGASGSTSWERICLGVFSIIVSLAQNQVPIALELEKKKLVKYLGKKEQLKKEAVKEAILEFKKSPIAISPFSLVDGYGSCRIAEFIFNEN